MKKSEYSEDMGGLFNNAENSERLDQDPLKKLGRIESVFRT